MWNQLENLKKKIWALTLASVIWITCHFIPDEFGRLHLTDAAEETPQLVLTHVLRQVIHYKVGFCIFVFISHVVFITVVIDFLLQANAFKLVTIITVILRNNSLFFCIFYSGHSELYVLFTFAVHY